MSNPYVIWAVVCLAIAAALFIVEIFIPSGGLIGILASAALVAGVVLLFMFDTTVGLVGAIVVLCCIPVFVILALRIWPNTPVARFLTLSTSQHATVQQPVTHDDAESPESAGSHKDPSALASAANAPVQVGDTGKALTELRPVGVCIFAGKRCDCLAAGPMIAAGAPVKVVEIDGMQIKVRAV